MEHLEKTNAIKQQLSRSNNFAINRGKHEFVLKTQPKNNPEAQDSA
jgi:hypothetical protein